VVGGEVLEGSSLLVTVVAPPGWLAPPFHEAGASQAVNDCMPPLSDSDVRSLQVGGCLQHFADFWDVWCSQGSSIPVTIQHRVKLDFQVPPSDYNISNRCSAPEGPFQGICPLDRGPVPRDKQAVSVIRDPSSPGYYSHIFLVPKKNGFWRLIIDLSRLNRFLKNPHFKIETTRSVATTIQPGDWPVSVYPDYQ